VLTSKSTKPALYFILLMLGLALGLLVGMFVGGAATPSELGDVGDLLRWSAPSLRGINDVAEAVTIGSLVFAAFALVPGTKAFTATLLSAAMSAGVWALAGTAYLVTTYLAITGSPLSLDQTFGDQFYIFVTDIQLGQMLALNVLTAFALAVLILFVRELFGAAACAAIGLAGLIPVALSGHAAGSASHAMAVNSLGLHLVGICIWVGGLVGLVIALNKLDEVEDRKTIITRYSTLALFGFLLVAISGYSSAQIRIGSIENIFTTGYGQVTLLKTVSLLTLGFFGALHRRRVISNFKDKTKMFWNLIFVEVLIFGAAMGLGTALARTPTPINDYPAGELTPAEILTGSKLPPEPTALTWITTFKPDLIWLLVTAALAGFYLLGVRRLKQRGDSWSVGRTVSWLSGVALLFYVTNGYFNAYEQYLFSAHMLAHMLLTMGVPVLLVPGAPVTLLARAVAKRQDDSRGVREWVLWAVHTKYAQFLSHPIVAALLFASSLVVFYFTPIFNWATREHVGHEWMIVHFVITGYLFVQALIGVDPGPKRFGYPQRLILLIATLAFHAFFGLALMTGDTLLLADWFGAMGRTWGATPLQDQQAGGAIAWGIGELPTAALTIIVAIQWARSDERDAKRLDRASDRSGNEDLSEYNRMLERLAQRKEDSR
jgi:cytochrome c oxidase assembly factor CtaG/putative copper export protein